MLLHSYTAVCNSGCSNGGTCTAPNNCSCVPQWTGPTCTTGNLEIALMLSTVNECSLFPFQMLMSVLLVLTTVSNSVPTPKEVLPVAVTLDISCWLMDMSVEVCICVYCEYVIT